MDYKDNIYVNKLDQTQLNNSVFSTELKKNDLNCIRFHNLRDSCTNLLLVNGVSLMKVQEYLGHCHCSTTANISMPIWGTTPNFIRPKS
ncbi:tyrosine-type recombinase/integrase [Paenibacillus popilliae]|uniref:tyrosine-type recombinase/integrase n=1 Tax=Paenibacillus popilliae TaxID=78057 RepID=UPI003F552DFB